MHEPLGNACMRIYHNLVPETPPPPYTQQSKSIVIGFQIETPSFTLELVPEPPFFKLCDGTLLWHNVHRRMRQGGGDTVAPKNCRCTVSNSGKFFILGH